MADRSQKFVGPAIPREWPEIRKRLKKGEDPRKGALKLRMVGQASDFKRRNNDG